MLSFLAGKWPDESTIFNEPRHILFSSEEKNVIFVIDRDFIHKFNIEGNLLLKRKIQNGSSEIRAWSLFSDKIIAYKTCPHGTHQFIFCQKSLEKLEDREVIFSNPNDADLMLKSKLMFGQSSQACNYVTDFVNGCIWQFDAGKRRNVDKLVIGNADEDNGVWMRMENLTGITLDALGNVIVATSSSNECNLQVFAASTDGKFAKSIPLPSMNMRPTGICLSNQFLYVADVKNVQIHVFNVIDLTCKF